MSLYVHLTFSWAIKLSWWQDMQFLIVKCTNTWSLEWKKTLVLWSIISLFNMILLIISMECVLFSLTFHFDPWFNKILSVHTLGGSSCQRAGRHHLEHQSSSSWAHVNQEALTVSAHNRIMKFQNVAFFSEYKSKDLVCLSSHLFQMLQTSLASKRSESFQF